MTGLVKRGGTVARRESPVTATVTDLPRGRRGPGIKELVVSIALLWAVVTALSSMIGEPARLSPVSAGVILVVALVIDYIGMGDAITDRIAFAGYVTAFRSLVVGTGWTDWATNGLDNFLVSAAGAVPNSNAATALTKIGSTGVMAALITWTIFAIWPSEWWTPSRGIWSLPIIQAAFAWKIKHAPNKHLNATLIGTAAVLILLEPLKAGGSGIVFNFLLWACTSVANVVAWGINAWAGLTI